MRMFVAFLLAAILISGCGKKPAAFPTTPASLNGEITFIEEQGERSAIVIVQGSGGPGTIGRARVTVSEATAIRRAGQVALIAAAELGRGQKVSVWFDGPVQESDPVQAAARALLIVEDGALPTAERKPRMPAPDPVSPPSTPGTGGAASADTLPPAGAEPPPEDATIIEQGNLSAWTAGIVSRPPRGGGVTQLLTVREGSHAEYDRVVFAFDGARLPGYHVEYVDRPVRECGSGETVPVAGDGWLQVRFDPARAHDEAGRPSLTARNRRPGLPVVEQIVLTCDFEGHVTWVLGVTSPNRYQVLELSDPARLVIDVRH